MLVEIRARLQVSRVFTCTQGCQWMSGIEKIPHTSKRELSHFSFTIAYVYACRLFLLLTSNTKHSCRPPTGLLSRKTIMSKMGVSRYPCMRICMTSISLDSRPRGESGILFSRDQRLQTSDESLKLSYFFD